MSLNEANQARELEILQELVRLERLDTGRDSLQAFVKNYLPHLVYLKRASFHEEMMNIINEMVLEPNKGDSVPKNGNSVAQDTIQRGDSTPPIGSELSLIAPPHFSDKNPKSSGSNATTSSLTKSNENLNRVLFMAPRGFGKSYVCSVFLPLWLALYKKKQDIFIVSSTISLGKELLRKVRGELENNERILSDFGEMKSDKWTEEMLVLRNGSVIRAKGRGFQIRGFRPDIVICDDLEDEEVIYSKDQRDKLEQWFFRTLLPALKPQQQLLYVGTKLHQFALIAKLEVKEEFLVRKWKAMSEGRSIWEELWPTEQLERLRKELGSYAFEAEYQNNPISLEESLVKPEHLDGVKQAGDIEVSCMAIDPAISEKTSSDPRAIVLMGRTSDGFREIHSEAGKWGIEEQMQRIISLYEYYKPDRVVFEAVAFQKVYGDILRKKIQEVNKERVKTGDKKLFIPISEAPLGIGKNKRPKDKFTRLLSVVHLFEQRMVEVRNPELYQELISFPHGEHDDLVDASVFALYWLINFRSGATVFKKEPQGFPFRTEKTTYVHEVKPGVFVSKDYPVQIPVSRGMSRLVNYDKR